MSWMKRQGAVERSSASTLAVSMWSWFGLGRSRSISIEPNDRFLKTDGKHQSVWIVADIVQFPDLPAHVRLVRQGETWAGYRTISIIALREYGYYSPLPRTAPQIVPNT